MIIKTTIDSNENLYNFLVSNCSHLFTQITHSDAYGYISCYVDSLEFIRFNADTTHTGDGVVLKYINSSGYETTVTFYGSDPYSTWEFGYTCKHGIHLTRRTGSDLSLHKTQGFSIVTDNVGKPFVIMGDELGDAGSPEYMRVLATRMESSSSQSIEVCNSNSVTVTCPIAAYSDPTDIRYAICAYFLHMTQYGLFGKLTFHGVDYLSNGYWVIKDE